MKRSQREAAARGSTHLLRLSLPAVRSNGSFEGSDILAEGAAVPAILLCRAYRAVMAWALTPAAEHPGLFPGGAADELRRLLDRSGVPGELHAPLEVVCELLADPAGGEAGRVAEACARIGEWAERRGDAPATALRFSQAAALSLPNDGPLAYRAGYVARRQASWDVAELWFRHASTVSRRNRDWKSHALAYIGIGNSHYQRGRYPSAKREHLKALRVSKRHGLRGLEGMAFHDLFAVAIETAEWAQAEAYAQQSFRAYGPEHPNVPNLAHDIAYFWNTRGHYARALPVLTALLPHYHHARDRIRVLGAVGRAAGGCGERETFMSVWQEMWQLAPGLVREPALPASLLQIAYGAAGLREWSLACAAAELALKTATARGEADVVADAEKTLADIGNEAVDELRAEPSLSGIEAGADRFAEELVASLQGSSLNHTGSPSWSAMS